MSEPIAVFYGNFHDEHLAWNDVARPFGWNIRKTSSLDDLLEIREEADVPAVFIASYPGDCLAEQIAKIRALVPRARVVACYPLSAPMLADELVSAGAFHSIPRPLNAGEVKQSLGFVWEAWSRKPRRLEPVRETVSAAIAAA
ncbi:MAG: hypothetical protein JO022_16170 [Acidobacteriaceae bacterium]|nr:hypothetical protein [Acidobacteriaceae bacterium]